MLQQSQIVPSIALIVASYTLVCLHVWTCGCGVVPCCIIVVWVGWCGWVRAQWASCPVFVCRSCVVACAPVCVSCCPRIRGGGGVYPASAHPIGFLAGLGCGGPGLR